MYLNLMKRGPSWGGAQTNGGFGSLSAGERGKSLPSRFVAFTIGDRTARTATKLWGKIPDEYKRKQSFSDFWTSYRPVFESDPTHEQVPKDISKDSGELAQVKRLFATLRQRLARYVRQTLSFSKSERMHHWVTKLFIEAYNREVVT